MDLAKMLAEATKEAKIGRRIIGGEELAELRKTMVHIPDLKPGDKVRFKGRGFKYTKFPAFDEVVEVFAVLPKPEVNPRVAQRFEEDFTILSVDSDGDYEEHTFDSRFFERVA